jgi:hypothetical protein
MTKITIYTVLQTDFVDDYKPRGPWSYSSVKIFKTLKEAHNHVENTKLELMEGSEYEKKSCEDEQDTDDIFEDFNKGEFISERYSFDIQTHIIDL